MSAVKSGLSLRNLVVTPERIPDFLIPSRSPLLLLSPRSRRSSEDRTRLLTDHDNDSSLETTFSQATSPGFRLRVLPPRVRTRRAAAASADADTDVTTSAAMSLTHVQKVITPYGFRAVLTASPCTRRRESLFHRNKVQPGERDPAGTGTSPGRSRVGLQVRKELKNARSPGARGTDTR